MSARKLNAKVKRIPVAFAVYHPSVAERRRNMAASQSEIDRLIERAVWHESQAEAARHYAACLQVRLWT